MRRRAFVALSLLVLAGCAAVPPEELPPRPPRDELTAFRLEGRIGVRNGGESFSANLLWQHQSAFDEIILNSPLGQGIARLAADADGAVLETADRKRVQAADLATLSEQVFGFRLPVDALPHWIVGRPAGGAVSVERDGLGRPLRLTEAEWTTEFLAYENDSPQALPSLVQLERGDVRVRLRIDNWTISP